MLSKLVILLLVFSFPFFSYSYQFRTKAKQAVILDLSSNSFIFEHNSDEKMAPSSMSKLMTLYIAFDCLKAGIINMEDKFRVSKKAWSRKGSSMFLREGQFVTVRKLLEGIIVVSGNDACITLAEGISGSEENFVIEMNEIAQKLALNNSHFVNSSGWPDEDHFMSAKDLVVLAKRILTDFPEYYDLFSEQYLTYNNISQRNENLLLFHGIGVDGLKTGYTSAGAYGIVASAKRNGRRVFVVVNGLSTGEERIEEAKRLIRYSLDHFYTKKIFTKDDVVEEVNVLYGKSKRVPVTVANDVVITYNHNLYDQIKVHIEYRDMVLAPIKKGQEMGKIFIQIPGIKQRTVPLYAVNDVQELNYIEKFFRILF
ncbi:D-alanyl-D-alanine carboxypeptidase [Wolbachia endosymbiont of Cruorifilaria tuberocauda]|uniref:D-alanyl-D-alanine carboxypeptidase family protein n=1 Tax=Wolbachia endosymbiont of Cruorifilaria tuberocauda TaxID=1812111 RepID=UPI00158D74C2|nr:D-alanyl-D-alanine carboxypeptidase family protein [Wolbachia endosymbiont of Cruorifilaria tuberocauda]QKX01688.1 D-alanyl-D-alanine carboxypeptidase [Wolbachia endosymbiont of Cruorifilaria tuberocauda]